MKQLHRPDLFSWAVFDEARNVDFNGYAWVRRHADGTPANVLIDPMAMTSHDLAHLVSLGGAAWIVVTNSDHLRATADLATILGAKVAGPAAEQHDFPHGCDRWLSDGDVVVPGMVALCMNGSKTPGELALLLDDTTLFTGDLVRAHSAAGLMMLPPPKLSDPTQALNSVRRLAGLPGIQAVLVGDGWPVFHRGADALAALVDRQSSVG